MIIGNPNAKKLNDNFIDMNVRDRSRTTSSMSNNSPPPITPTGSEKEFWEGPSLKLTNICKNCSFSFRLGTSEDEEFCSKGDNNY